MSRFFCQRLFKSFKQSIIIGILSCFALSYTVMTAQAAEIANLRMAPHLQHDRVVFDLTGVTSYKVFYLTGPDRIVIDFEDIKTFKSSPFSTKNMFLVRQVRYGRKGKKGLRVVFDLKGPLSHFKDIMLKKSGNMPDRLIIDLFVSKALAEKKKTKPKPHSSSADKSTLHATPSSPSEKATHSTTPRYPRPSSDVPMPVIKHFSPMDLPVIVIDPGHGGKDPGAIGACNKYEKYLTLQASKYLYDVLKKSGNYTVYLTRSNDRYISLKYRRNFALEKDADLFISIHADSLPTKPTARGFSVYTVSNRASDTLARQLMHNANQTDQIFGLESKFKDKDGVRNVLVDLAQNDTKNQSISFATLLLNHIKKVRKLLDNPHRHAGFYVLKIPNVPSVLIELGFLSNRKDCRYLSNGKYVKKIAHKIKDAIDDYYGF